MLVLLRLCIGWHFLYAGIEKLQNPDFSSSPFLDQAKGPFAGHYWAMIPDFEGHERLSLATNTDRMRQWRDRVEVFYKFNEAQRAAAEQTLAKYRDQAADYLNTQGQEIADLFDDWERLRLAQQHPERQAPPFGQAQLRDKQTELRGKTESLAKGLQPIHEEYERELYRLRTEDQRAQGPLPVPLPERLNVDTIVTYSTLAIGFCLIVGLFTRLAAMGGGLFLLSIVLAQPDYPGVYPPPHPSAGRALFVTKEFIEMVALFLLATTHVGRWGGLDFILHGLCRKCCSKSSEGKS